MMDLSSKLSTIYQEKSKNTSLYDYCGFENNNVLSNHALNLSCIILSSDYYDKIIDYNWTGNIVEFADGRKYRETYADVKSRTNSSVAYGQDKSWTKSFSKYVGTGGGQQTNSKQLTKVKFSKSFNVLDGYVFYQSDNVIGVNGPEITKIGNKAFYECHNVKNLYFPKVNTIENGVFYDCTSLKNVDFLSSCNVMFTTNYPGSGAQFQRAGIENVLGLSNSTNLLSTQNYSFQYCSCLTSTNGLNHLTGIGSHVFEFCDQLTDVYSLSTLISIVAYTFNGCTKLSDVYFPNATKVNQGAFRDCKSLRTIDFGLTSETYPTASTSDIFNGCTNVVSVYFSQTAYQKLIEDEPTNWHAMQTAGRIKLISH